MSVNWKQVERSTRARFRIFPPTSTSSLICSNQPVRVLCPCPSKILDLLQSACIVYSSSSKNFVLDLFESNRNVYSPNACSAECQAVESLEKHGIKLGSLIPSVKAVGKVNPDIRHQLAAVVWFCWITSQNKASFLLLECKALVERDKEGKDCPLSTSHKLAKRQFHVMETNATIADHASQMMSNPSRNVHLYYLNVKCPLTGTKRAL